MTRFENDLHARAVLGKGSLPNTMTRQRNGHAFRALFTQADTLPTGANQIMAHVFLGIYFRFRLLSAVNVRNPTNWGTRPTPNPRYANSYLCLRGRRMSAWHWAIMGGAAVPD
ncbi:hypothetical protein AVEN_112899-1 [Araneus ventricosus]|uniref:Uncharacterized protein n=1 Tax=Araneus ventricosus TaxID=182803 RepID=A0A4Y2XBY5_ARAVE|nr:hypothetical protein AVEN_112899-1 [Araneus ventricosus]